MHLLRISVSKDARISRTAAYGALCGLLDATATDNVFPRVRGQSDAVRIAAGYRLLAWRTFTHAGRKCKAIASSPEGANGHGLNLHVHVQVRDKASVKYSSLIARIVSPHASKAPETIREEGASEFRDLYADLDAATLVQDGQEYLYDNDLRNLLERILDSETCGVWNGVSLVYQDSGVVLARNLQRVLGACLSSGSVSCRLIALEMSEANREALARELAEEWITQLEKLTERCGYTSPNMKSIQSEYEALAGKITQAEQMLGVEIPVADAQIETETAIMALA